MTNETDTPTRSQTMRRSKARCEKCGPKALWDPKSWMVDGVHDGDGRVCACCGAMRVELLWRVEEDGSSVKVADYSRPRLMTIDEQRAVCREALDR